MDWQVVLATGCETQRYPQAGRKWNDLALNFEVGGEERERERERKKES